MAGFNPNLAHLAKANTALAWDLYGRLRTQPDNLFFSPYSIAAALAMTFAGARGETHNQMSKALHLRGLEENLPLAHRSLSETLRQAGRTQGIQLLLANSFWPQQGYPFLKEYLLLLQETYAAQATPVDYVNHREAARQSINDWIESQTDGLIRALIPQGILTSLTRLTLVNAIYFKGLWSHPFHLENTIEAPFWVTPVTSVLAQMMRQTRSLRYAEADGMQIVELPYTGERLALLALLPQKADSLDNLERKLPSRWEGWLEKLAPRPVSISLPRLRLDCAFRLDETLQNLGMPDAFNGSKANFSGMDGQRNWLYLSAVLHQAVIEVNEQGSEAAAVTAVMVTARSMPQLPVEFRADHPFLMLLWDRETQTILFMGRVNRPS